MIRTHRKNEGFILPTVLVLSLTVLAVMVGLLVVTSSSYSGGYVDHYQKLADEAAEAGTAYATACLSNSSHVQTWGAAAGKPSLSPNTDCNGDNSFPSNSYVHSDSTMRSYFTVGDLDFSQQFSAQVSAYGYVETLNSSGQVVKTYTSVQKKVLMWPTDISAQMSASGTNRTCAIVNYKVYCWGYNKHGQLGDGRYVGGPATDVEDPSAVDSRVPVKVLEEDGVMAGKSIVKIFVAQYHSCALSSDGIVYCWGYNSNGQLGNGTTTDPTVPVRVDGALSGKVVTDIGGTNNVSCAIADQKIYCWGNNNAGMTGRGLTSGFTLTPTLVTAGNTSTTLATNYTATMLSTSGSRSRLMCAVASGKAYCWGQNSAGSVGDGSAPSSSVSVPTKVLDTGLLSGKTITSISQEGSNNATDGYAHVCVVASGALYCWGENNYGQLGNNSTTDSNVPVAVVANGALNGKTIQDVKLGIYASCARASSGVYCWGRSNYGQLGDGTYVSKRVPTAVSTSPTGVTSSNVVGIGSGANRGCAVTSDGRTFCWGLNTSGQIGDGTLINRPTPTESLFLRPEGNQYIF